MAVFAGKILRDSDFKRDVVEKVVQRCLLVFGKEVSESFVSCIQCGMCTGSCPSGGRTILNTRQIVLSLNLETVYRYFDRSELWYCTTCYTCQERCPRKVRITDLMRAVRNIAVENGYMSKEHRAVIRYLYETGHSVPIREDVKELRAKLGLPEVPPTTHQYGKALEEVRKLMEELNYAQYGEEG
ncbi:MAG: disulfide reductase [Candidatus Hecatellales archaeon B24]|nr:MAG: disulfide reductase [Candidatus Hecatellales archaeon B24]